MFVLHSTKGLEQKQSPRWNVKKPCSSLLVSVFVFFFAIVLGRFSEN